MMDQSKLKSSKAKIFLGVDGGQSHTEAIIADEHGNVLGRGTGGASNHTEIPGGRERLQNAIRDSVDEALKAANLPSIDETVFASAYCGMTGGAIYKKEIIGALVKAEKLLVGHDAPTALFGATAGKAGIVVIAGTGSIVYGETATRENAQVGGLGYLFSDEGSGFWLAAQVIRLAIKEQDGLIAPCGLQQLVLNFFNCSRIRDLTDDFYNGRVSRDRIAKLAEAAHQAAENGNETIRGQIRYGCDVLAESVKTLGEKLDFPIKFPVASIGGMFRARLMNKYFETALAEKAPNAEFIKPRFNPAIGALLIAYRQAGVKTSQKLMRNLDEKFKNDE